MGMDAIPVRVMGIFAELRMGMAAGYFVGSLENNSTCHRFAAALYRSPTPGFTGADGGRESGADAG